MVLRQWRGCTCIIDEIRSQKHMACFVGNVCVCVFFFMKTPRFEHMIYLFGFVKLFIAFFNDWCAILPVFNADLIIYTPFMRNEMTVEDGEIINSKYVIFFSVAYCTCQLPSTKYERKPSAFFSSMIYCCNVCAILDSKRIFHMSKQ